MKTLTPKFDVICEATLNKTSGKAVIMTVVKAIEDKEKFYSFLKDEMMTDIGSEESLIENIRGGKRTSVCGYPAVYLKDSNSTMIGAIPKANLEIAREKWEEQQERAWGDAQGHSTLEEFLAGDSVVVAVNF